MVVWRQFARPPYLPTPDRKPARFVLPNPKERRFWALFFSYALGAFPLAPVLYVAPLVLNRLHGMTQADLGKVLWIPPLGWEIGYFFWGWAADRGFGTSGHPLRAMLFLMVASLPIAAVPLTGSSAVAVGLLFWSMFAASGFIVLSLRIAAEAFPSDQTAMVAGIGAGSWSAVVAVMLPLLGRFVDRGQFVWLFLVVAALPVAGVAGWSILARRTSTPPRAATQ
jgi:ACS family hexuronate transporter-like MFS transporter